MTEIKIGDMLFVKTSGEAGFVKDKMPSPENPISGLAITLRIPKKGGTGIYYVTDTFWPEELETNVERMVAEYRDMKEAQEQLNLERESNITLPVSKLAQ